MLSFTAEGQLLRHKYGGFYRSMYVILGEPKGLDGIRWPEKIVIKHIWPFEQLNQVRDVTEMDKFIAVEESSLVNAMLEYTAEQYQERVAESKRHGKQITGQYRVANKC